MELAVELVGRLDAGLVGCAQVDQADPERRHRVGPYDAVIVVARLDDRADQARDADPVGAHVHGHGVTLGRRHLGLHLEWVKRTEGRLAAQKVERQRNTDGGAAQVIDLVAHLESKL